MAASRTKTGRSGSGVDHLIRRRVSFARQLLVLARAQIREPQPISFAGLLTLHDAIETFLIAACRKHNVRTKDRSLAELVNNLAGKLKRTDPLPHSTFVTETLIPARADLKHDGRWPNATDLSDWAEQTHAFFRENCKLLFGFQIREARLLEFVEPPLARDYLREAETQIEAGDLQDAAVNIVRGLAHVENHYGVEPGRRWFSNRAKDLRVLSEDGKRVRAYLEDLETSLREMEAEVAAMRAGIDLDEYESFRSLIPVSAQVAMSGRVTTSIHGPIEVERDDMIYCLDYVVDLALRLSRRSTMAPVRSIADR